MRPEAPTYWLLDGTVGWQSGWPDEDPSPDRFSPAAVGAQGIRLRGDGEGALSLTSDDGSLGGLVLPRGFALDASHLLHLFDQETLEIKRFHPATRIFEALPGIGGEGIGGESIGGDEGMDPRQFAKGTQSIAISGEDLYVVDKANRRVQVFSIATLALRFVWHSISWPDDGENTWNPIDVASNGEFVVILDSSSARVYGHQPGANDLHLIIHQPDAVDRWSRVIIDRDQRIYLLDAQRRQVTEHRPQLEVYSRQGVYLGGVNDVGEISDRFPTPAVRLDHKGRFCLTESLASECARAVPDTDFISTDDPLSACHSGGLLFNARGLRLCLSRDFLSQDPAPLGPRVYQVQGTWISAALDSQIYHCQWHRLELALAHLPTGAQVVIRTYVDNVPRSIEDILLIPDHLWESRTAIVGGTQPAGSSTSREVDTMVRSGPGQYLWLRLDLSGDGYSTPVVTHIRAHYPRSSYLQYLPAIYRDDEEARAFSERFLALFQTEWDAIEQNAEAFARYLDPQSVPESRWADYLAKWLALPLEGQWNLEQKRHLLNAAPEVYEGRGTIASIKRYLQAYLRNITGLDEDQQGEFPLIIEGFRKRNYLLFNDAENTSINRQNALWSPDNVGRLQLDVHATADDVRLVSTGDPDLDLFQVHAHRFQVFVPSYWVNNRDDERMLRRAVDTEKPAHTAFDLCLVEPRMRVGIQSTVGVDTIIGAVPIARLDCVSDELPPSRPPRHRLGYDTVLAGKPSHSGGIPLDPGTRVGLDTLLS